MIPFSIYAFIAVVVAFAVGFFLGKKQTTSLFNDPDFAKEAGEKGRKAVQERIEKLKRRVMERAREQGRITNDDVEDHFCISDATANKYLNDLEDEGLLVQHGTTGRGVYYTPTLKYKALGPDFQIEK